MPNAVAAVTVEPAQSDSNATVAYLDGSDTVLTDADMGTTGFQAALLVGATTIKVKVTAEDDATTETYAVVVTRTAAAGTTEATIAAGAATAIYNESGASFTVTRTGATTDPLDVVVALTQTKLFLDAGELTRTVTIAAGSSSKTLSISAGDLLLPDTETRESGTLTATVLAGTGYNPGTTATAAVDVVVALTVSFDELSYSVDEGVGTLQVKLVARTGVGAPAPGSAFFSVSSQPREAVSPEDYGALSVVVEIPASAYVADGDVYRAEVPVDVEILDDTRDEPDERLHLALEITPGLQLRHSNITDPDGIGCRNPNCGMPVTIEDNDATPTVTLVLTPPSITENGGLSEIKATLARPSSEDTSIDISAAAVSPAVAGDFELTPTRRLSIPVGKTESVIAGHVTLEALNNAVYSGNKSVTISGTATNDLGIVQPQAQTVTIEDDESGTATDATLSGLALKDAADDSTVRLSPVFAPATTSYTALVGIGVDEITVEPTENDSEAAVAYLDGSDTALADANAYKTGFQAALAEGTNTVKVKVRAADRCTTRTYTMVVTRPTAATDAALTGLALKNAADDTTVPLIPDFATGTKDYTTSVASDVTSVTVEPAKSDSNATVAYLDAGETVRADADPMKAGFQLALTPGPNTIKVKVTAEDAFTTETYTVVVTQEDASDDATLSGLALKNATDDSAIDLNETFAAGTKSYTADVLNAVDEITVEPTSDNNATFAYLNASDTVLTDADSLKTGFQAALAVGANTIKVKVTAEAGDPHTDTYTVVVTRRAMTTTPPAPAEIAVPNDWSLIPTGLGAGDKFRLLFLSSTKTNGESYDIADYNSFIQGRAAAGHTDIQTYSPGFRAVGCTADSDARDNTATTGAGVVIYWLNGAKAADNYGDFYDGSWGDEANDKDESGGNGPNTDEVVNYPLTGCKHNGTEDFSGTTSQALGESTVGVGRPSSSASGTGPIGSNNSTAITSDRPMYGLSQVFEVAAADASTDATLSDLALKNAADDSAIDLNETFATGTKSYTADVLNAVDEITVEPTSDNNATFAYLNASDTVLTDADSLKTGFQAALAVGANTIKVKVTAESGDPHTDTYTVVVTRRAMTTTPPAPAEIAVPNDWSLIPTGLGAGDKFRLLFLSSTKTNGESYDIADYNTFIQGRAAAGHTDIQTYSPGFRAVGCTADSDARDNTGTTGAGVRIYWLNGAKAADNYADFYNGNWDAESNSQDKNELGTNGPNTSQSSNYPLTGCDGDGTEDVDGSTSYALGESEVRVARPGSSASNAGPLTSNSDTAKANTRPMYGLSQVFEVAAADASTDATLSGLALADNNGTAVALTPSLFVSTTKDYTADVANGVTSITLTPTVNDSNAAVEYLDASDAAITDTDSATPALDAPVVVGANTVKVKVTAEDDNTTDTYTVVVTRGALGNAMGAPAITGAAQVGKVLTAGIGTIADAEGLPGTFPDDYTLQWVRVDADGVSNPRNRGTNPTYTVVAGDAGKKIKVEVSFTDDGGTAEGPLPSAAYPSNAPVAAAKGACPADNDWCSTLTVGFQDSGPFKFYGFSTSITDDALADTTIEYGVGMTWTVSNMRIEDGPVTDQVTIRLDAFVPRGSVFNLGGTTFTVEAGNESSITGNHLWPLPAGFAWVHGQDVTVSVRLGNFAATGKPEISGTIEVGETLTATTARIADADGLTSVSYTYRWIRVDGTNETNIAGATGSSYTLVGADEGKGIRVRVSFTDDAGSPETLTSDIYRAVTILPAPRLPSVDDPNAIWMATLTVANLGSNQYGYKGSQGGLTDTAFTYLGDDTPLSGGLTYRKVGTLYTIDELSYHTGTGQLLFSLDGAFVGGSAANIFVDVGGTRRSFSQAVYTSGPHTYTFGIPNPSWSAGDEVTVKIVVLEEANGPENLAATIAESGDRFDVTLTWAAPTSGGAVTGYRVEYQPDPALQWRTLEASQSGTTYADSGLARGTVRYYRVAALRSGGASYSEIVRVQAPSETQEVPEKVNHVDVKPAEGSDTALEVAWNRPRTPLSRAPATGYHVQYAQHDGAVPVRRDGEDWATVTFPTWMEGLPWRTWSGAVEEIDFEESTERSPHLKTVVTGLAPGTNYRVRVRGCTEAGCGEWSYPRRWTTSGATLNATEAEPLTATLEDFPVNHDGSGAFTFRIAFSAEVEITPEAMRDHALTVTGGTVTAAAMVDDRKDLWALTLEPAGTGAVSILVPQDRACTETGALCTADGQALSTGLGHSVPGPAPSPQNQQALAPLAAGFVSVPPEHDGSSAFWLELSFDAAVEQGSKQRIRALLGVTGGSVTRMRRKDGRLDHWRVRVEPSSHGAVTVTLSPSPPCGATGAVCTEDGRTFTTALATLIQGPPGLTVADAEVQEAANATLAFAVTLSRAPSGTVTVDYATSDGTAAAGSDYTATSGTLTFAAGETGKTVSVAVLDDAHDEGSETLSLTLSNASGAHIADGSATGTITNNDHMPQAWLARFGRTVADQVLDAVEGRMTAPRAPGTELSVAGQRVGGGSAAAPVAVDTGEAEAGLEALAEWLRDEEDEDRTGFESRPVAGRDILTGSSFAFTEGSAEGGFGAVWGRGAISRFDGREGDLTLDGEVTSAMVGADWTGGSGSAGLAVAHSRGEGDYRSPAGVGAVESTLTGVYPYGRYDVSERLSLWGVVGYGTGTLTLTPDGQAPIGTDMDLSMAAVGGRSVVVKPPADGGLELAATADAMVVQTASDEVRGSAGRSLAASEAEVTRVRFGFEGTWRGIETEGGGSLVPGFEIGVRQDGGDAETGFGADIGAGLAWSDPAHGIAADVRARGLLTHEDGSFRERGFAGSFAWDPAPSSDLGPRFTLSQRVGASATGGMDALLRLETAPTLGAANDEGDDLLQRRLETRFGYGFPLFGGRYTGTPAIGFGLTEAGREYIHSWRLAEARSEGFVFGLDVEGTRRESVADGSGPEHVIEVGLGWRLEGARREGFDVELRLEGSRLVPANDDRAPEDRIGLRMSARW